MALNLEKSTSASMIKNIASKSSEENLKKTIRNISIDLIDFNEDNDKIFRVDNLEPLVLTIQRNGFEGSIEVFQKKNGRYEIISGHRRFLANKLAGNKTIPAEIKEEPSEIKKADSLVLSNITARQLTPMEKGRAIVYYKEHVLEADKNFKGNVRAEIAKRFGYSEGNVHKYEALTKLIKELQDLVEEGYPFSAMSQASTLKKEEQLSLYEMLLKHKESYPDGSISRTRIEDYIDKIKNKNKPKENPVEIIPKLPEVEITDDVNGNEKTNKIENVDNLIKPTKKEFIYYADIAIEESVEKLIGLLAESQFKDKEKVKNDLKRLEISIKNFK